MDSKYVQNMQSSLPNKVEKYCISLAFIIRIYHDAQSSECQIIETENLIDRCLGKLS